MNKLTDIVSANFEVNDLGMFIMSADVVIGDDDTIEHTEHHIVLTSDECRDVYHLIAEIVNSRESGRVKPLVSGEFTPSSRAVLE